MNSRTRFIFSILLLSLIFVKVNGQQGGDGGNQGGNGGHQGGHGRDHCQAYDNEEMRCLLCDHGFKNEGGYCVRGYGGRGGQRGSGVIVQAAIAVSALGFFALN